MTPLPLIKFEEPTVTALVERFNQEKADLEKVANPMYQQSLLMDLLWYKMQAQHGDLEFSLGEAYLKAGIPKQFLRH